MVLSDLSRKEQKLEELEKVLNKFKQGENFHKFRNTAIYHSFRHNYDLYSKKLPKGQRHDKKRA